MDFSYDFTGMVFAAKMFDSFLGEGMELEEKRKKIGIMGGTFDPIHLGHLMTAEAVRDAYHLDQVLFIPAAHPPHKQQQSVTPAMHRYLMTVLATADHADFMVSSLEMQRSGPSYSIDTVQELIQRFGKGTEFFFIAGADAIQELPSWKRIGDLLEMCQFIAATRPGCMPDFVHLRACLGSLGEEHIHQLITPALEISSTDIRDRVHCGHSIRYLVPAAVEQYIYKEGLYR